MALVRVLEKGRPRLFEGSLGMRGVMLFSKKKEALSGEEKKGGRDLSVNYNIWDEREEKNLEGRRSKRTGGDAMSPGRKSPIPVGG